MPESHKYGIIKHCVSQKTKEVHLPNDHVYAFRPGADEDDSPYSGGEVKGVPILMNRGDVLFLKSRTMHASMKN